MHNKGDTERKVTFGLQKRLIIQHANASPVARLPPDGQGRSWLVLAAVTLLKTEGCAFKVVCPGTLIVHGVGEQ